MSPSSLHGDSYVAKILFFNPGSEDLRRVATFACLSSVEKGLGEPNDHGSPPPRRWANQAFQACAPAGAWLGLQSPAALFLFPGLLVTTQALQPLLALRDRGGHVELDDLGAGRYECGTNRGHVGVVGGHVDAGLGE